MEPITSIPTMQVLLLGMLGETLAYSIQAAINSPDKLDKRLDPVVMGPAVLARMSAMGFMPMIADTGFSLVTGGESLLAPGSTASGSNNRNLFVTPSMVAAGRLVQAPQLAGGALFGTGTTTRKEFRDAWATVRGSNTYGLRGVGNWFAEGFPVNEPNAGSGRGSIR